MGRPGRCSHLLAKEGVEIGWENILVNNLSCKYRRVGKFCQWKIFHQDPTRMKIRSKKYFQQQIRVVFNCWWAPLMKIKHDENLMDEMLLTRKFLIYHIRNSWWFTWEELESIQKRLYLYSNLLFVAQKFGWLESKWNLFTWTKNFVLKPLALQIFRVMNLFTKKILKRKFKQKNFCEL